MDKQCVAAAGYLSIFLVPTLFVTGSVLDRPWLAFGVAFALIHFFIVVFGIMLVVAAATTGSGALIGLAVFAVVAGVILAALVQAALGGIYAAALYRFATQGGTASNGFDANALQMSVAPKA